MIILSTKFGNLLSDVSELKVVHLLGLKYVRFLLLVEGMNELGTGWVLGVGNGRELGFGRGGEILFVVEVVFEVVGGGIVRWVFVGRGI